MNDILLNAASVQIAQRCWRDFRMSVVDGSTTRLQNALAIAAYASGPRGSYVPLEVEGFRYTTC
jgi:hypothetical protein